MSQKKIVMLLALALAFAAACKSEVDGKPAAETAEPAAAEETAGDKAAEETAEAKQEAKPAAVTTVEVPIDHETSKIGWVGAKVTGDHTGGFNEWKGTAAFDADSNLHKVAFEVQTASIFSDSEKLTGHLKSDDFFSVEQHPTATFESTKIIEGAEGDATHTVTGNMTIKGVTKQISFPATLKADAGKWNASSEFTIKRFDFNIEYKGKPDDLIKDDVLLKLDLNAALPTADKFEAQAKAE